MDKYIIFGILGTLTIIISRRTLFNLKSHGFYRLISWLCIAWIIATNYKYWFESVFSPNQLFSWFFLFVSGFLAILGFIIMKNLGKPNKNRNKKELFQFEQTTELIDKGIFKYIRHPLYSSLLYLTWGLFLKSPTQELLITTVLSTVMLYLTAKTEEKENVFYFGEKYKVYMKRSKKFIPFIY